MVSLFDGLLQRGDSESAEKRGELSRLWTLCDPLRAPRLCDEKFLLKKTTTRLQREKNLYQENQKAWHAHD